MTSLLVVDVPDRTPMWHYSPTMAELRSSCDRGPASKPRSRRDAAAGARPHYCKTRVRGGRGPRPTEESAMLDLVTSLQDREFEDRGRRWARCTLHRFQRCWLEIPLLWPGTREQAETIVHAFAAESLGQEERERLVEAIQSGARAAWREITVCERAQEDVSASTYQGVG